MNPRSRAGRIALTLVLTAGLPLLMAVAAAYLLLLFSGVIFEIWTKPHDHDPR